MKDMIYVKEERKGTEDYENTDRKHEKVKIV